MKGIRLKANSKYPFESLHEIKRDRIRTVRIERDSYEKREKMYKENLLT